MAGHKTFKQRVTDDDDDNDDDVLGIIKSNSYRQTHLSKLHIYTFRLNYSYSTHTHTERELHKI